VGGLLGRVAMRVSGAMAGPALIGVHTSNGNRVGDITLEGTIALVFFAGVAFGVLGGVVYAVVEPWLRRFGTWQGLVFGVGLLVAAGFTILDPSNFDFARFGSAPVNVAMFAALFVAYGLVTVWLARHLRELGQRGDGVARAVQSLSWLALVPAALLLVVAVAVLSSAQDPLPILALASGLAIAAVAHWRRLPPVVGHVGLSVPLVIGAVRLASGLPELLRGL
jgi:hypothetical protein